MHVIVISQNMDIRTYYVHLQWIVKLLCLIFNNLMMFYLIKNHSLKLDRYKFNLLIKMEIIFNFNPVQRFIYNV